MCGGPHRHRQATVPMEHVTIERGRNPRVAADAHQVLIWRMSLMEGVIFGSNSHVIGFQAFTMSPSMVTLLSVLRFFLCPLSNKLRHYASF